MDSTAVATTITGTILGLKAQVSGMSEEDVEEYLNEISNDLSPHEYRAILNSAAAAYALGVDVDNFIEKKEQRDKHRSITDP